MKLLNYLSLTYLALLMLPSLANASNLLLIDNDQQVKLPIEQLRKQANSEFTIFSPFYQRDIKIKGIFLETLLQQYLSYTPNKVKLIAIDGYQKIFTRWKKNHWVVVTHEDGHPLSIRQRGPLRLVEIDYKNKNPKNLRDFNDWIWMLQKIEVQQ